MRNEFNNKAKDYANGRPTYPKEILDKLIELGIDKNSNIADIGAGTGLFTNMLCELGSNIFAIEPNLEMINECKEYCDYSNIRFICAPAEKTTLEDNSIDMITIAQAFHWFDKKLCKIEFKRILRENGHVLTIWNSLEEDNDFTKDYMNLIHKYEIKTNAGNSYFNADKEKFDFFGQDFEKVYYDNYQRMTLNSLISNAVSISYTPSKADKEYNEFIDKVTDLFNRYNKEGYVTFHYKTEISIGKFAK